MNEATTTKVTEIAPGTYRLSTFTPSFGIQFNQFLVADDEPFLMHTGFRSQFASIRRAVAEVIEPAKLRWIGFSHFESDECGALNDWLAIAPNAQAASSVVGVTVNLGDFASRPSRALADDEVLALGKHRLRFLATPHVPHGWDAGLFFDETEKTLFCSDLFFQPGEPGPLTESSLLTTTRAAIEGGMAGPLANDVPYNARTDATMRRLAALAPKTLATMHWSSFRGDCKTEILGLAGAFKELLTR
jgi:glyoxylase-like metal-dependent hydrolase (beta-lactamase superfamily II)